MESRDSIRFKQHDLFTILEVDRKLTLYKNIMSDELKRFLSKPLGKSEEKQFWVGLRPVKTFRLNFIVKLSGPYAFLEERRKDADRLREKYPDKVPVIVQVAKSSEIPQTKKPKYLMPKSISIGKVQTILRDYLKDQDVSFPFRHTAGLTSGLNIRSYWYFSLTNQKRSLFLSKMWCQWFLRHLVI